MESRVLFVQWLGARFPVSLSWHLIHLRLLVRYNLNVQVGILMVESLYMLVDWVLACLITAVNRVLDEGDVVFVNLVLTHIAHLLTLLGQLD